MVAFNQTQQTDLPISKITALIVILFEKKKSMQHEIKEASKQV